ncbi:MAG TPA: hypothetical protein ENL20_07020 [Candidatus Cloacimonetes bacterium]|nr:hypothetical protein [Candidatus Cloacimonadota bacterium]
MFRQITSERGFGLVHVIAALMIVTVALVGIFISTFYAQKKATENYHYRAALLIAADRMEQIKFHNKYNEGEVFVNIAGISGQVILDERDGNPLWAQVMSPSKTTHSDLEIAPYVVYDKVTITVRWQEASSSFFNPHTTEQKEVVLREDYYRKFTL